MKHIAFCLFLLFCNLLSAQQSSKSKSRDRFREKDDGHYPMRVENVLSINQEGADIAPVFYKEGIVFVSSRAKNGPRDPKTNETLSEHFYALFDKNGAPSFPQKFRINDEVMGSINEGPLCFSRDGETIFATRNNNIKGVVKANKSGKSTLKIYQFKWKQNKKGVWNWNRSVELPFNSDDYSCMHPCLSPDGSKLFFSSDMPGGLGGFDLYYAERKDSTWGQPVNLGPVINTDRQEIFPFISQSGTLFFSSSGRANTLGGLDIYYVNNPLNNPEEVVNLGEGINSGADDKAFIIDDTGKNGYFSSNRSAGVGKDDIYQFEALRGIEGIAKSETNPAQFTVADAGTGTPLQGAAIRVLEASEDGFVSGNKDFYTMELASVPGKPDVLRLVRKDAGDLGPADLYSNAKGMAHTELTRYHHYLVIVSADGYGSKEKLISVKNEKDVAASFGLNRKAAIPATDSIFPTRDLHEGSTILLDQKMYDSNKATLNSTAVSYLDAVLEVLREFPEMEIDLTAHTDTRGDAKLNLELTEERAKNAKTYLLFKGIDAGRVNALGKGESEPLNRCAEGVDCSEEEHRQNNRLEIRIRKVGKH